MSTMDTTNTNENEMIKVSDDEAINFRISFQLRTARRTLSRTQSL